MRKYLKVCFGTESQFIVRHYKQLQKYGDLKKDENLRRLINNISEERFFKRSQKFNNFKLDPDQFYNDVKDRTFRGVLDAAFLQLAKHLQMDRWGDKTPEYVHNLHVLRKLYPDAQYIHIVRDGRDVASSSFKHGMMGVQNMFMAAMQWKESIENVDNFSKSFDTSQFMEFRYEDFLTDPVKIFSDLIKFLEIDDSDNKLIDYISSNIKSELKTTNFNKWKTQFSKKDRILYESVAADVLKAKGYETIVDRPRQFSSSEKVRWYLDNRLKQMLMRKFWEDNFYKLNLRVKSLFN
nr:sulfotransferase [uncultured Desulfobacter sp.]